MNEAYDPMISRRILLEQGIDLAQRFCKANKLVMPQVRVIKHNDWRFDACAYYRPVYIAICVEKCAPLGKAGRSWSWPGNTVDRTPHGVIQHELGHHVDHTLSTNKGSYFGNFSRDLRRSTGESPLTTYSPNDAEWFAEIFRLFVTNPNLLEILRPKTYVKLREHITPAFEAPWEAVLLDAPERTIVSCKNKIDRVRRQLAKEAAV